MSTGHATRDQFTAARERRPHANFGGTGAWLEWSGNKVLMTTAVPEQKTAWTKARKDVLQVARQAGYETVQMPASAHPGDWMKLMSTLGSHLQPGGHILIEYPFDQRKRIYGVYLFCKLRGIKLYGLVHDLDSLRFGTPPEREMSILRLFDGVVSHNPSMTRYLREGGVRRNIVDLNLFDYCGEPGRVWHEQDIASPLKVLCAGNMSYPKARYIYDPRLGELQNVELSLYGAFFEPERMPPSPVQYKGAFDPDTPELDGPYHFGLVWDGTGVDTCAGNYGHYMRFNNPHKLSLYVSLGLPVVVWKEAAIAEFVVTRGIGVTVSDLRDLGDIPSRVSSDEYREMAARITSLSQRVKRGEFVRQALGRVTTGRGATYA